MKNDTERKNAFMDIYNERYEARAYYINEMFREDVRYNSDEYLRAKCSFDSLSEELSLINEIGKALGLSEFT